MFKGYRLPRKVKKVLKKDGEKWIEYKNEKSIWKEREEHLDVIFSNFKKRK